MSEDIELLRAFYEEFARTRTFNPDHFAPDFIFWQPPPNELKGGLDQLLRASEDFEAVFDEFAFRPQEFMDNGDCILVTGRMGGRAKASGALIDQPIAHEWRMRDGKAIQLCAYGDNDEGRERRRRLGPASSANLDLVRSIFANWERGDLGDAAEWAHPEIELVSVDGPDPGRWTGLAAMADETRSFISAWEHFRCEAEEYRELDDERLLVLYVRRGRGKTSGFEIEDIAAKGAGLFEVRGGKVARLAFYWDRERALADLGLTP